MKGLLTSQLNKGTQPCGKDQNFHVASFSEELKVNLKCSCSKLWTLYSPQENNSQPTSNEIVASNRKGKPSQTQSTVLLQIMGKGVLPREHIPSKSKLYSEKNVFILQISDCCVSHSFPFYLSTVIHFLLYIVYLVEVGRGKNLSLDSQVTRLDGKESASPEIWDFEKIAVTEWDLRLSYLVRM